MTDPVWRVGYAEYDNLPDEEAILTTLHYTVDLTDGEYTAHSYGTTPAVNAEPKPVSQMVETEDSVLVAMAKESLGTEQVESIEQGLYDNIDEQKNPTSGGFTPPDESVTPA